MGDITGHFSWHEFASPPNGTHVPKRYRPRVVKLCEALEIIRSELGDWPVTIVSGYRTPIFNRKNKGRATRSQHLYGRAADIRVQMQSVVVVYWTVWNLQDCGLIPKGGLAAYRGFVHYDIRGWNARWRKAP